MLEYQVKEVPGKCNIMLLRQILEEAKTNGLAIGDMRVEAAKRQEIPVEDPIFDASFNCCVQTMIGEAQVYIIGPEIVLMEFRPSDAVSISI